MGQFDEFIEMGEAVEKLGDTPPSAEDIAESQVSSPTEMEADGVPDVLSGGLSGTQDEEDEQPLDLERLFGTTKEPKEQVEAGVKETTPEPSEPPSGTDARFKDLTEQLRRANEINEAFAKERLGANRDEAPVEVDDGLEPEVSDYLKPYIEREVSARMAQFEADLKPIRDKSERESIARMIGTKVEGFNDSHVQVLETHISTMSEEDKALYGQGLAGAVLLARDLADRGVLKLGKQKAKPSPLASRHQSEMGGRSAATLSEMSEEEQLRRLNSVSGETMRRFLIENGID